MLSEGFMDVQWAISEVVWHRKRYKRLIDDHTYINTCKNFFEKFGSRVKKLTIFEIDIHPFDFLKVLNLMPIITDLLLKNCAIYAGFHQALSGMIGPVGILELSKLKTLKVLEGFHQNHFLHSLWCPSIDTFHLGDEFIGNITDFKFLHHHNRVSNLLLEKCQFSNDRQTFEQICKLSLTTLSLTVKTISHRFQIADLIASQPQLVSLDLYDYTYAQTEPLPRIVKLHQLESLTLFVFSGIPNPKQLAWDMMQMPKLKSLSMIVGDFDFIKALLEIGNSRLETLRIFSLIKNDFTDCFDGFATKFSNLKCLRFQSFGKRFVDGNFLMLLAKLETLSAGSIDLIEGSDSVDIESVREIILSAPFSKILKLIRLMPSVEKVNIVRIYDLKTLDDDRIQLRQLFDELLSLKNLIEIICTHEEVLQRAEVIECFRNRLDGSKLQRITFELEYSGHEIVPSYVQHFPFKRVNIEKNEITMSRY